jgi:hypothetical protein
MSGARGQSAAPGAVQLVGLDDPSWRAFVTGHPAATCFHEPGWLGTLVSAYGFRPRVAVQRDADGSVVAGVPLVEIRRPTGRREWSCLPFSDECAPLAAPGGSVATLLRTVDELRRARGIGGLVVRTGLELPGAFTRQVAVTHAVPLGDVPDGGAPARPRPSVRRHISNAARLGVRIEFAESMADVVGTYYALHVATRHRQGVPPQPRRYFRLLWERMIEPGHGFVLIARHQGCAVAGAVFLTGGRTMTYKYGASDARFWSVRPNHALMAAALARAGDRGFTTFDMGRTDLDNPGLARFKESWGAQPRPLRYTSFSPRAGHRERPPSRGVLALVIQRSPAIVGRGLGELFYRYAA